MTGGVLSVLGAALAAAVVVAAGWARGATAGPRRAPVGRGAGRDAPWSGRVARPPVPAPRALAVAVGVTAVGVAATMLGALGTVGLVGAGLGLRVALVRAAARRRVAQLDAALPELVALLELAASAGHPVSRCIEAVAPRAPPVTRSVLADVRWRVARGAPLPSSLEQAGPDLGPLGPALVDALVTGLVTGAPLVPALRRVGDAARDRRRRRAEESARRLPVTLLLPLVCCILPAFGLLAIVPLLAASLESLDP